MRRPVPVVRGTAHRSDTHDLDPALWRAYDEDPDDPLKFGTIWSFPERDKSAGHKGDYRGNFAPQVPRQCIRRFSRVGDLVLDPFLGSGTTLVECARLGRRGVGVELNPTVLELARGRVHGALAEVGAPGPGALHRLVLGDARDLSEHLGDSSVDLAVAHPPYHGIIKYSDGLPGDLSCAANYPAFLRSLDQCFAEVLRVLKPGRHFCVLLGDAWADGELIPIGFDGFAAARALGFVPHAVVIKEQHNVSGKRGKQGIWKWRSVRWGTFLFQHEYLFVFRKPGRPARRPELHPLVSPVPHQEATPCPTKC